MVQTWRLRKMTSVCIQLVVIVVTLSLSDVVCQTVHNINISDEVHSGRQRRQALTLTQQQRSLIVDLHNKHRASEGASNMVTMIWNTSLASMAATWAASCRWGHPASSNTEYRGIGQNLYASTGSFTNTVHLKRADELWYIEKRDYNYVTMQCVPGKMCGHYTQVVWENTRHVGCAYHRCDTVTNRPSSLSDDAAVYYVCNYWPGQFNIRGRKPYKKGAACTECGSGYSWCRKKLCDPDCSSNVRGCWCAAKCYNCGKPDSTTCQCQCAKGWYGVDCQQRCIDTHNLCNAGWWPDMCDKWDVKAGCPAMCQLCVEDKNARPNQCEPVTAQPPRSGSPGKGDGTDGDTEDSAQTKFIMCHQSTMIFVMVIISFIIYDAL